MTKTEFIIKYGLDAYNKKNEQRREWYKNNKDYEKQKAKDWKLQNKDQHLLNQKNWYQNNHEKMLDYNRDYYEENTEYFLKKYCENIEYIFNYELAKADNFVGWEIHHILENFWSMADLKKKGLYYNVNPESLIFIRSEIHATDKGISGKHPERSKWHKRYYSELKKDR